MCNDTEPPLVEVKHLPVFLGLPFAKNTRYVNLSVFIIYNFGKMFRLHLARRGKSNLWLINWPTRFLICWSGDNCPVRVVSHHRGVTLRVDVLETDGQPAGCDVSFLDVVHGEFYSYKRHPLQCWGRTKHVWLFHTWIQFILLEKFSMQFERLNEACAFPEDMHRNKCPRSVTETLTGAHFQRMLMATSPKTTTGVRQTGRQSTGWRPTLSFFHQLGIWPKSSSEWFPWVSPYFIFKMKCCSCQCVNKRGSGLCYSSCKYVSVSGNMSMRMYLCVQVNAFQCLCTDIMCM